MVVRSYLILFAEQRQPAKRDELDSVLQYVTFVGEEVHYEIGGCAVAFLLDLRVQYHQLSPSDLLVTRVIVEDLK
jgi:hypothetical protein